MALEAITKSKATFFRWQRSYSKYGIKGLLEKSSKRINTRQLLWDKALYLKILMLRQKNPCWGKIKIHTILYRDFNLSAPIARIGKIISYLVAKNKVKSVAFTAGKKLLERTGHLISMPKNGDMAGKVSSL